MPGDDFNGTYVLTPHWEASINFTFRSPADPETQARFMSISFDVRCG